MKSTNLQLLFETLWSDVGRNLYLYHGMTFSLIFPTHTNSISSKYRHLCNIQLTSGGRARINEFGMHSVPPVNCKARLQDASSTYYYFPLMFRRRTRKALGNPTATVITGLAELSWGHEIGNNSLLSGGCSVQGSGWFTNGAQFSDACGYF